MLSDFYLYMYFTHKYTHTRLHPFINERASFSNHPSLNAYLKMCVLLPEVWVTRFRFNIFVRYFSSGTGPRWFFWWCLSSHTFFTTTSEADGSPALRMRKIRLLSHPCAYQWSVNTGQYRNPGFSCDSATSAPCTCPQLSSYNKPRSKVEKTSKAQFIKRVILWPVF